MLYCAAGDQVLIVLKVSGASMFYIRHSKKKFSKIKTYPKN
jgi:hypothetical protein